MFKKGDWIIATKKYNGDGSWRNAALKVIDVTPYHLVYVGQYGPNHHIMPMDDIIGFGFILAEPSIIGATKKMRNWEQVQQAQQPQPVPKKKVLKTFECWVNAYPNGFPSLYLSELQADGGSADPTKRLNHGKAFHFVGQYTVEE